MIPPKPRRKGRERKHISNQLVYTPGSDLQPCSKPLQTRRERKDSSTDGDPNICSMCTHAYRGTYRWGYNEQQPQQPRNLYLVTPSSNQKYFLSNQAMTVSWQSNSEARIVLDKSRLVGKKVGVMEGFSKK